MSIPPADDTFYVRVAGTSFRQESVSKVVMGASCHLEPEPGNKFDSNALKVIVDGEHIGYIPKDRNGALTEAISSGCTILGKVVVVGRPEASDNIGVAIELHITYPS